MGLLYLYEYVCKHRGRKCILLVDEYDAICSAAFSKMNATVLGQIIDFYSGILGNVLKLNTDFVDRGILTGVTRVMCAGQSGAINNVVPYPRAFHRLLWHCRLRI